MTQTLTKGQRVVLLAFYEFGAMNDTALSVYVHHIAESPMSSSGIRTRRAELTRTVDENGNPAPLLRVVGTKKLKSGRRSAVHDLTELGRDIATDEVLRRAASRAVVLV